MASEDFAGNMTMEELEECCKDEDCRRFLVENMPRPVAQGAKSVQAGQSDWLSFFLQVLPQLAQLIAEWRKTKTVEGGSNSSSSSSTSSSTPKSSSTSKEGKEAKEAKEGRESSPDTARGNAKEGEEGKEGVKGRSAKKEASSSGEDCSEEG